MLAVRATCIALTLALAGGGCSNGAAVGEQGVEVVGATSATSTPPPYPSTSTTSTAPVHDGRELSPLAELVESAGDSRFDPESSPGPAVVPVGFTLPALDLDSVSIRDVGVEENGEMEIPGATEIGWYRWSPPPGERGSSVLAAHIAWNGRDGVFRDLDRLRVGDRFQVIYDDGSIRTFEVAERAQYAKNELPLDRVFARDGDPGVVLITCGGDFNRSESSYEDNVVAYAVPVEE